MRAAQDVTLSPDQRIDRVTACYTIWDSQMAILLVLSDLNLSPQVQVELPTENSLIISRGGVFRPVAYPAAVCCLFSPPPSLPLSSLLPPSSLPSSSRYYTPRH